MIWQFCKDECEMEMVHVPSHEMRRGYGLFRRFCKTLPSKVITDGCITFSAYIGTPEWYAEGGDGCYLNLKEAERLGQLVGPHGEALFKAWAYRQ